MAASQSSDKCFKCHELGHWAKDCPNNSTEEQVPHVSLGNGSLDKCYKCHELGHWAKDCPNVSTQQQKPYVSLGNGSSDKCFKCHKLGHWAKDCHNNSTQQEVPHFSLGNDVIPPKLCRCRTECRILISNTSTNPGRKFYRCKQCNFFEWCDEFEASASQNPDPNTQSRNPSTILSSPSNNHGANPILSSPSNNPNPNSPTRNPNTSAHEEFGSPQQSVSLGSDGRIKWTNESSILCECEAGPCRLSTAQTKKNKGRQFFKCPIKEGEGSCGFFKWLDELDSATSSSSTFSNDYVRYEPEESVRRNGTSQDTVQGSFEKSH